jgi:hypothetical protein
VRRGSSTRWAPPGRGGVSVPEGAVQTPSPSHPFLRQVAVVCDATFPVAPPGCCYGVELRIDDKEVGGCPALCKPLRCVRPPAVRACTFCGCASAVLFRFNRPCRLFRPAHLRSRKKGYWKTGVRPNNTAVFEGFCISGGSGAGPAARGERVAPQPCSAAQAAAGSSHTPPAAGPRPPHAAAASDNAPTVYQRFKFAKADPSSDAGPEVRGSGEGAVGCGIGGEGTRRAPVPCRHTWSGRRPRPTRSPPAAPAVATHRHSPRPTPNAGRRSPTPNR